MTPLVELSRTAPGLFGKLEFVHPSGSIKHRSIPRLLEGLRGDGRLPEGRPLVIHSAGSAAITAAWAGARLGCPVEAIVPRTTAQGIERKLEWWGARCHRIPSKDAPGFIANLVEDGAYLIDQQREASLVEHYREIGAEIFEVLPEVEAIVAGVGTGASISGIARELRARGSTCRIIGVEPEGCRIAAGEAWAPHKIPGLAPPFPQPLLDHELVDELVAVSSADAWSRAQELAQGEGWAACPASGASVEAALRVCGERGWVNVVALLSGSIEALLGSRPSFD